jgi:hypothetical protein
MYLYASLPEMPATHFKQGPGGKNDFFKKAPEKIFTPRKRLRSLIWKYHLKPRSAEKRLVFRQENWPSRLPARFWSSTEKPWYW